MKNTIVLLLLFVFSTFSVFAQNDKDRALIKAETNLEKLQELLEQSEKDYQSAQADASIPKMVVYNDGQRAYLIGLDPNGQPIYARDDNQDAAISSKVDRIQVGGSSGYDLDGEGIEIGVWESMIPRIFHQEITGNVLPADAGDHGGHATHTATTLIGKGIVPSAKGMAPAATLRSHNFSNDESEIAAFAMDGGILSNHSYSSQFPDDETALYGVYGGYTAEWDQILFNAPYLTIIRSASNNRDDGVNVGDGGYDILYGGSTAKNTLIVGAIQDVAEYVDPSSIEQSDFSNWGPTDDWRIKPDITANGVGVYSGNNGSNTDYSNRSGTSMSTPVVTGTVALLQQFFHSRTGNYLKAATVKALLICTTDEAGAFDGPDFQSGWGLLNAERAAEVIDNNGNSSTIKEVTLMEDEIYTLDIEVEGNSSLELAMAWTDPPAIPLVNGGIDNSTSMLINDLDVRISGNNNEFSPWTLVPDSSFSNFNAAPTKGDNFRDNVERIDISNLEAGVYTVTVSHKNSLVDGSQDFSMVINGIKGLPVSVSGPSSTNNSFLVYPVPSNDGRLLSSDEYAQKELQLNIAHLDAGVYFVSIKTEEGLYTKRVVVTR